MSNQQSSRRSFRVTESIYLKYEVISDREFHEGLDRRKVRKGVNDGVRSRILDIDARFSEALYVLNNESERSARCMTLLNDKLNAVIDHLPELRESKASLAKQAPQTSQLGADGIAFATDRPYEPGTKMSLRFLLASDNRYIESFCRVVRQIDDFEHTDEAHPYAVAVEFHDMNAAQKEILIQHLFTRESETLRMRRLKIEAAS